MRRQVARTKGRKERNPHSSCVPTRNLSSSSIAGEERLRASLGMTEGGLSDWTESRTSPQIEGCSGTGCVARMSATKRYK
jgi:hypothetical protein